MSSQPDINNATLLLNSIEGGAFHDDLSKAIRGVVGDLSDHRASHGGKANGEITIKLKFSLDEGMMEIRPDFTVKVPKVSRGRAIYFVTPENNLSRQDPKQIPMDLDIARDKRFGNSPSALAQ